MLKTFVPRVKKRYNFTMIQFDEDKQNRKVDDLHHEYIALKLSDDRQNRQLDQVAKKMNIKLAT